MTVAFAATKRRGACFAGNLKFGIYQLTMPTSTTSGGDTCDISGDFDFIQGASINLNDAVDELAYKYSVVGGTLDTTHYGYPAATIKVVAHQSKGSNAAMDEADSVNLSGADSLFATFWGV
jgi:hypothetical protein